MWSECAGVGLNTFSLVLQALVGLELIMLPEETGGGSAAARLRNVNAASAVGVHVLSNQAGHGDELFEDKIFIKK